MRPRLSTILVVAALTVSSAAQAESRCDMQAFNAKVEKARLAALDAERKHQKNFSIRVDTLVILRSWKPQQKKEYLQRLLGAVDQKADAAEKSVAMQSMLQTALQLETISPERCEEVMSASIDKLNAIQTINDKRWAALIALVENDLGL